MPTGIRMHLIASAAALSSGSAIAQTVPATGPMPPVPAATAHAPGARADSPEIVVTARRVTERLQDTPVAVTAITAADLTDRSVFNTQDIGRLAPSLNIRSGGGSETQSFIFIRGIGQGNDNPSLEPGVGIYVDDVFMPRSQAGLLDVNDVAQIEVVRGPQGTLFGKNTIGGAIQFTSRLPGPTPERAIVLDYGRYNEERVSASINQPLDDQLFLRVSGTIRHRSGYQQNLYDGRNVSDISSGSGRAMLRFRPSSSWDFLLSADGYQDRSLDIGGRLIGLNRTGALNAIEAQVGPLAPFLFVPGSDPRVGGGSDVRFDPDIRFTPFVNLMGTSFQATWSGDHVTIKSITAYRELHSVRTLDVDATPRRVLNIADETMQDQFSQEFRISGDVGNGRVNYLGGLFYYDENIINDFRQTIAPLGVRTDRVNDIGTTSYAAYLNLTWHITDAFSATAGGRYTHETRSLASTLRSLPNLTVTVPRFGNAATFDDFSPKLEMDYRISSTVLAYVSASRGFKSGGFNNQASNAAQLTAFQPETAWSYEAGLKTQTFDRRLTVNIAGFYTDYRNLQLNVFASLNGSLIPVVTNAASAKIYGVEVEANLRLSNALSLFGNFSYDGSHYSRFFDAALGDLSAKALPNISKYTFLLGGQYQVNLSDSVAFRLSGNYSWRSRTFLDATNSPVLRTPSAEVLNARAALVFRNGLEVAVFGKNLTNQQILQSGSQALGSLGIAWGTFSAPSTYGVEASWRF